MGTLDELLAAITEADESGTYDRAVEILESAPHLARLDRGGVTPLHYLCATLFGEGARELAGKLLRAGANVAAIDADGWTALHHACMHSDVGAEVFEIVELLVVTHGAPLDVQDKLGRTALYYSCQYVRGGWEPDDEQGLDAGPFESLLVESGANVTLPEFDGVTPLHLAVVHNDLPLARLLLAHGARPDAETTGVSGLYEQKLILVDNHTGVPVPVGSTPRSLVQGEAMRQLLADDAGVNRGQSHRGTR